MNKYYSIKSFADLDTFKEKTNALHDGYIIAVEYRNNGIKISGDVYEFNPELEHLIIRVLITSIQNAVLEMVFESVLEWKITKTQSDIVEVAVCFNDNGFLVLTDDATNLENFIDNDSYVIAKKMKWRFL